MTNLILIHNIVYFCRSQHRVEIRHLLFKEKNEWQSFEMDEKICEYSTCFPAFLRCLLAFLSHLIPIAFSDTKFPQRNLGIVLCTSFWCTHFICNHWKVIVCTFPICTFWPLVNTSNTCTVLFVSLTSLKLTTDLVNILMSTSMCILAYCQSWEVCNQYVCIKSIHF